MGSRRGKVLVVTTYASEMIPIACAGLIVDHRRKENDYGMGSWRRRILKLREAVSLAWAARSYEAVVILTSGPELAPLALLCRLFAPRTRLVAADPLLPATPPPLLRAMYRRVNHFVVIRRRDRELLSRRFGVAERFTSFAHWPADLGSGQAKTSDAGYVYAAGWAHRDWDMFLSAIEKVSARVILSADLHPVGRAQRGLADVEIIGPVPPERGRELMRAAAVVAMPLKETDLPAGPLVLLDAMSAGKAVVATRTGGTVDYIRDGVDGLLVPPGDPATFADALGRLLDDAALRERIGQRARAVRQTMSSEAFWSHCLAIACPWAVDGVPSA